MQPETKDIEGTAMFGKHRCVAWGIVGFVGTFAFRAWAQSQDASLVPATPVDPNTVIFVELLKGGGLPAVVAALAYMAGRGGGIGVTVSLSDADRALVKDLLETGKDLLDQLRSRK